MEQELELTKTAPQGLQKKFLHLKE